MVTHGQLSVREWRGTKLSGCAVARGRPGRVPGSVLLVAVPLLAPVVAESPVGAATTVAFWHVWQSPRQELVQKAAARFAEKNPQFKVEETLIDQTGMTERYLLAIAGGSPPDVMMVTKSDLVSMAAQGAVISLDAFIVRDGLDLKRVFYPGEVALDRFDNKTWGLPATTCGGHSLLWWNRQMLNEAGLDAERGPRTWSDLKAYAKVLTRSDAAGNITRIGLSPPWSVRGILQLLYTNAGSFISDDARTLLFAQPEGVQAVDWLVELTETVGGRNAVTAWARAGQTGYSGWWAGRSAMVIAGSWLFFQTPNEAPHMADNYGVGAHPYNDANPRAKSVEVLDGASGCWSYAIPKGAKNPEGAWEWIKYMTFGDGNRFFFQEQIRPSAARAVTSDPFFRQKNRYWPVVIEVLSSGVPIPLLPVTPKLYAELNQARAEVQAGRQAPGPALAQAAERAQAILNEWWSTRR